MVGLVDKGTEQGSRARGSRRGRKVGVRIGALDRVPRRVGHSIGPLYRTAVRLGKLGLQIPVTRHQTRVLIGVLDLGFERDSLLQLISEDAPVNIAIRGVILERKNSLLQPMAETRPSAQRFEVIRPGSIKEGRDPM